MSKGRGLSLFVLAVLGGVSLGASQSFAAAGGCFVGAARMSDASIDAFLAAPSDLLTANQGGGLALAGTVRGLAGSSADALPKLQSLIASADASQKAAIGAGLARAARACQRNDPEYAQQIQALVAGSGSPELVAAFVGALNEIQTAALGAGAGGAAAAAGIGNTGAGNGTSGSGSDAPITISTADQAFAFSSGRSVGSVSITRTTVIGGGTTSVSPAGG